MSPSSYPAIITKEAILYCLKRFFAYFTFYCFASVRNYDLFLFNFPLHSFYSFFLICSIFHAKYKFEACKKPNFHL